MDSSIVYIVIDPARSGLPAEFPDQVAADAYAEGSKSAVVKKARKLTGDVSRYRVIGS